MREKQCGRLPGSAVRSTPAGASGVGGKLGLLVLALLVGGLALMPSGALAASSAPLSVIENVGQFDPGARFLLPSSGGTTVWLAEGALWITALDPAPAIQEKGSRETRIAAELPRSRSGTALRLTFPGAAAVPRMEPFGPLETKISYFLGQDSAQWRANVPVWSGVRYVDLFPGVDLELSGEGGVLTPRLVVKNAAAGSQLASLRLRVEGARSLEVASGAIRCATATGTVTFPLLELVGAPALSAGTSGSAPVGTPRVSGNEVLAPFGSSTSRASSPESPAKGAGEGIYSTYLGGWGAYDEVAGLALDSGKNAYLVGYTQSTSFPVTPGAFQEAISGGGYADAFVSKLDPTGTRLVYSTYLGGRGGDEQGLAIAVDSEGYAYVTGYTGSESFPTTPNAFQKTLCEGNYDVFVTKLNREGTGLEYSTYLGGNGPDKGQGIALDSEGNVYVAGRTEGSGTTFPTTPGAFQTVHRLEADAFVTKFKGDWSGLAYSTLLGGDSVDEAFGIAVDDQGYAAITGKTTSDADTFPVTVGAFLVVRVGGTFLARFHKDGGSLEFCTYMGGSEGRGVALPRGGAHYYVVGSTPAGLPIWSPDHVYQPSPGGLIDAFVARIYIDGTSRDYRATYLGGDKDDFGRGIVLSDATEPHIIGFTEGGTFPVDADSYQPVYGGGDHDAFLAKFDANLEGRFYATYLGGGQNDEGRGVGVDGDGAIYGAGIAGEGFPVTPGSLQGAFAGPDSLDGFVVKLLPEQGANPTPVPIALQGKFLLQGHGVRGHRASMDLRMRPAAGGATTTAVVLSHSDGAFALPLPAGGEWRVAVKERHTLAAVRNGTVGGPRVDFGELKQGDADNNNIISILDFSILATTFGKSAGGAGYDDRGDFNGDQKVSILDFSLLASNFGQSGENFEAGAPAVEAEGHQNSTTGVNSGASSGSSATPESGGCDLGAGALPALLALPLLFLRRP